MARKVQVLLVDDLDGTDLGTNGETVTFGMGGERYEIDLSKQNAEKFRDLMGRYVSAGRNVTRTGGSGHSTRRTATGSGRTQTDRDETKAARSWLVEHGILSPDSRGRISAENWERYRNRDAGPTVADVDRRTREMAPANAAPATPSLQETKGEVPAKKAAAASPGNSTTPAKATAGTKTPEKATA